MHRLCDENVESLEASFDIVNGEIRTGKLNEINGLYSYFVGKCWS